MGSVNLAQSLLQYGVSRPTFYSVNLPSRWGQGDGIFQDARGFTTYVNDYMDLFCKNVSIPEGRLDVVQANGHEHMGITRETAMNVIYGKPLTMTIIENSDFDIYKSMRAWFNSTGVSLNQSRTRNVRMNYYDNYVAEIVIKKYELPNVGYDRKTTGGLSNYKSPISWRFINAYPIRIGSIDLASDATDQALEFSVDFTYESYSIVDNRRTDNRQYKRDGETGTRLGDLSRNFNGSGYYEGVRDVLNNISNL